MRWNRLGVKVPVWGCVVLLLSACGAGFSSHRQHGGETSDGKFLLVGDPDFDWTLTGDRRVAPLQVFSDNARIWLQWHAGQPVPTVMVSEAGQWLLVKMQQQGRYSVIDGSWRELRFQGGKLRAHARYGSGGRRSQPSPIGSQTSSQTVAAPELAASVSTAQPTAVPKADFEVKLADQTIRQVLLRWARDSQWHFSNSHWSVSVDIPVTAHAVFQGDFIESVRSLLAAVEISGRPLQPCFYANRVLRVISAAESCDPTARTVTGGA